MLEERQRQGLPWHRLPHLTGETNLYHICASCYEHKPVIGANEERLTNFTSVLLETLEKLATEIYTWCVLPNHYHVLLMIGVPLKVFIKELGKFHGRLSYVWNGADNCRGRKVWCNTIDRWIRDEAHFYTAMNDIHHNPVKHGLVEKWQEWPCSGATNFLQKVGQTRAKEIWYAYPVKDYGVEWLGDDL